MGYLMVLSLSIKVDTFYYQGIETPNNDKDTTRWTRTQLQEHY